MPSTVFFVFILSFLIFDPVIIIGFSFIFLLFPFIFSVSEHSQDVLFSPTVLEFHDNMFWFWCFLALILALLDLFNL